MEPMPFYQDEQIPLKLSPNTETLQPVSKQARNPKAISVFRLIPTAPSRGFNAKTQAF